MNVELINRTLVEDVAAGFGWLPIKQLAYVETPNSRLLAQLEEHGGPIPYITCGRNPGFFQRGISYDSDSFAQHAGTYVGKKNGEAIRKLHPDLLKPRELPHDRWQGHILPPVPAAVNDHETIESQALINTDTMINAVRDGEQVVAFVRDWTVPQIDAILYALYFLYGAPYDVFEISKHVFPGFPNPRYLKVCSSYQETGLEGRDPNLEDGPMRGDVSMGPWLVQHGSSPEQCTPGHCGRYFFENSLYRPVAINCDLAEAREKV